MHSRTRRLPIPDPRADGSTSRSRNWPGAIRGGKVGDHGFDVFARLLLEHAQRRRSRR
jgi:hypothetical protein